MSSLCKYFKTNSSKWPSRWNLFLTGKSVPSLPEETTLVDTVEAQNHSPTIVFYSLTNFLQNIRGDISTSSIVQMAECSECLAGFKMPCPGLQLKQDYSSVKETGQAKEQYITWEETDACPLLSLSNKHCECTNNNTCQGPSWSRYDDSRRISWQWNLGSTTEIWQGMTVGHQETSEMVWKNFSW